MKEKRADRTLEIFLTFLKFGCFTFGGGWSIVAQIQKEFVEKKHWITDEELLEGVKRHIPAGTEEINQKALAEGASLISSAQAESFAQKIG